MSQNVKQYFFIHSGLRTAPNLSDLALAFDQLGIYVHELEDYVQQVNMGINGVYFDQKFLNSADNRGLCIK